MQERHVPGVALAAIQAGQIVREQGFGFADEKTKTPVTPSSLFQAASVSKPGTALGTLHLVEQRKISLDEEINPKLRHWHIPENRSTQAHPVTLRLILSHSADRSPRHKATNLRQPSITNALLLGTREQLGDVVITKSAA
jgi:CubicO group peptidase (beta-lactamase class C family)